MNMAALDGDSILSKKFPAREWIVPGILTHGLIILAGKPKAGKSRLVLQMLIDIATGGRPLGSDPVPVGDVLAIDLENGEELMQERILQLLPSTNRPSLSRLRFSFEAPRIDKGLVAELEKWRQEVERPVAVSIDVFAKVKPDGKANKLATDNDYAALSPLQEWATRNRIAVIVVHHLRKGEIDVDDPLSAVSGSTGMTGAPDIAIIMNRSKGVSTLYANGRSTKGHSHVALAESPDGWFQIAGDAGAVIVSEQRQAVLDAVLKYGPITPLQVSDETGLGRAAVRKMLNRMDRDGKLGDAMSIGEGRYVIRGLEQRHTKPFDTVKSIETKDISDQTPVTPEMSPQENGSHNVQNPGDTVTPVTIEVSNPVTGSNPYDTRDSNPSVTSDGEISMSNEEKSAYLLNWLYKKETVTFRDAQQRCSPTLKGEDIRIAAPDLAKAGLIEILEDGKAMVITEAGSLKVNPQQSLF